MLIEIEGIKFKTRDVDYINGCDDCIASNNIDLCVALRKIHNCSIKLCVFELVEESDVSPIGEKTHNETETE